MFSVKLTKELVKKSLDTAPGISTDIKDSDITINEKNITIKLKLIDKNINFIELISMIQKQIAYTLNEHTDSRDYKVDIILCD